MDSCQIEIGPTTAIGHALICPPESSDPCKLGAVYRDSQTFRDEIGFHSEFSIEGSGGLPGVFEVKSTATFGTSYTYTKEYSKGLDPSYDFYVPPGRACVPTQVPYREVQGNYLADVKVEVRTLEVIRTGGDAKASLEFDNGQSISGITCLY
ncbi:hypothetical protein BGZ90_001683 [Linnemannia elongata]|nr:hypothetical protein BGZ90_001683 [Linnemannia elongata]